MKNFSTLFIIIILTCKSSFASLPTDRTDDLSATTIASKIVDMRKESEAMLRQLRQLKSQAHNVDQESDKNKTAKDSIIKKLKNMEQVCKRLDSKADYFSEKTKDLNEVDD